MATGKVVAVTLDKSGPLLVTTEDGNVAVQVSAELGPSGGWQIVVSPLTGCRVLGKEIGDEVFVVQL